MRLTLAAIALILPAIWCDAHATLTVIDPDGRLGSSDVA